MAVKVTSLAAVARQESQILEVCQLSGSPNWAGDCAKPSTAWHGYQHRDPKARAYLREGLPRQRVFTPPARRL